MFQVLTEQDTTHEKGRRTTSIRNAKKTMAGN